MGVVKAARGGVRDHRRGWQQPRPGECPTGSKAGGPGFERSAQARGEKFGPVAVAMSNAVTPRDVVATIRRAEKRRRVRQMAEHAQARTESGVHPLGQQA